MGEQEQSNGSIRACGECLLKWFCLLSIIECGIVVAEFLVLSPYESLPTWAGGPLELFLISIVPLGASHAGRLCGEPLPFSIFGGLCAYLFVPRYALISGGAPWYVRVDDTPDVLLWIGFAISMVLTARIVGITSWRNQTRRYASFEEGCSS